VTVFALTTADGDWVVDVDREHVTVAALAAALGLVAHDGHLLVDGRRVPVEATVAAAGIGRGTALRTPSPPAPDPTDACDALPRLEQIAGLDAGASVPLRPGRYAVGPPLASGHGALARGLVAHPTAVVDTQDPDERVVTRGALFRVAEPPRARPPALPDARGLVVVHRPPRPPAPDPLAPPAPMPAPPDPPPPPPLSWVTVLAPLPVAVVMALAVAPQLALVGAASPVLALGRWVEARMRHRRSARARDRAAAHGRADHDAALRAGAEAEARRRWLAHPDPPTLRRALDGGGPLTWSRRRADADALALVVAAGPARWADDPAWRPGHAGPEAVVESAPIVVPLRDRRGIGVVGPADAARSVARWLAIQAAALHGPSDLAVALLVDEHRMRPWDWMKWLPHVADPTGARRVATDATAAQVVVGALADELAGAGTDGPTLGLVVVDGAASRGSALRDALTRAGSTLRAVVVAGTTDELPAWCDVVVHVDGDGIATVVGLADAPPGAVTAIGTSEGWTTDAARALGRYDDPEHDVRSDGRTDVALVDALALRAPLDRPEALADELVARWRSTDGLRVTIGASAVGAFALDLVADGPHALVAGTTGAGKSELLRSWIAALATAASPDHVNLILVDFKGGGAFDACADLPHVVGVVTDLDAPLAARALRCLRAEVRHRERRLRDAGSADLAHYAAAEGREPLPRLVVMIDEFATLATELPEFVGSIVDVAQRGRSLGIHLVLATQRPHGVVDHKVRANTDIRVALRVQDDADALDVVGTLAPARFSRRTPGRAVARLGSGDVTTFQTALVSAATGPAARSPDGAADVAVRPFTLVDAPTSPAAPRGAGPSDLEQLVTGARLAARRAGCNPPRVPWPPPLPTSLDADELWAHDTPTEPWSVPLGLADEPDAQRRRPWIWCASAGNLLVYGADLADAAAVLTTLAFGLATRNDAAAVHLYVLDGGAGRLGMLADLPHCGGVVDAADAARVARTIELVSRVVDARRDTPSGTTWRADPGTARACTPLVVVVVDNLARVLEAVESGGDRAAPARLLALLRDGPAVGVVFACTAHDERAAPGRLATLVPQRITLRLADATGYLALGLSPRSTPALHGLRGLSLGEPVEIQFAAVADPAGHARSIASATAGTTPGGRPEPVRSPGATVTLADVGGDAGRYDAGLRSWSLVVAASPSLRPVRLELPAGVHALVCGPPASGRSHALGAVARAAQVATAGRVRVVTVVPRRSPPLEAIDAVVPVADPEALLAAVASAGDVPAVVLVDDAEQVAPAMAGALVALVDGGAERVTVVAAGRADQLRSPTAWTASLRHGRTGIALQPAPGDGDVFRVALPVHQPLAPAPGRGWIVGAGTAHAAQVLVDG
jgi:S-DNA-T family DNA segregation ATPase FtsK/SpoIIIE